MKARARIDKYTGEIAGITIVTVDADIEHVQATATHDVIDLAPDHPAIHAQSEYEAPKRIGLGADRGRELKRKMKRTEAIE